jgi:hypothetical protein
MNFVWRMLGYGDNTGIHFDCANEITNTLYNLYGIKTKIMPTDDQVKEDKSGTCELFYNDKKVELMYSARLKEFFTIGKKGLQQLGSKRDKDVFYKHVHLFLL